MAEALPLVDRQTPEVKREHVDFDAIIESLADDLLIDRTKKLKRLLKKDRKSRCLTRDVDWSRVDIEHEVPVLDVQRVKLQEPPRSVLYEATFTNNMSEKMQATFQTTRSSKSSCVVTQEQTYSYSTEVGCTLALPYGVVEASSGFTSDLSLGNSSEQTSETEMTWNVDTNIDVKPKHVATAQLIIEEGQSQGPYKFRTKIKGVIRVTYLDRSDNNSFVTIVQRPIDEVVKLALDRNMIRNKRGSVEVRDRTVYCTRTGCCDFRYGAKQDVVVKQEPIKEKQVDAADASLQDD